MSRKRKPNVRLGGGDLSQGQMPCPGCSAPIMFPFASLFAGRPIWCSGCGARLSINLEESRVALDNLRRAQQRIQDIREKAKDE